MSYIGNRPVDAVGASSGGSEPTSGAIGELFYNTTSSELLVWNGSAWVEVSGGGGGVTTGSTLPGTGTNGQLFYLTTNNKLYVWNSSFWEVLNGTVSGTTLPVTGAVGDLYYVTTTQLLHVWNGTAWDVIGGGSSVNSGTVTPASGDSIGQLFFNTVTESVLIWNGIEWLTVSTVSSLLPPSGPTLPVSGTEGEIFYNTTDNSLYVYADGAWTTLMAGSTPSGGDLPVSGEVGELFFDSSVNTVYVWNGTDWIIVGGATSSTAVEVGDPLPVSGNLGQLFYQTSDENLYLWDGSAWQLVSGEGGAGVEIGSSLPGTATDGSLFYLTTDNELYIRSNGAWVSLQDSVVAIGSSFPVSVATGYQFFNTVDSALYIYDGASWISVSDIPTIAASTGVAYNPTTSLAAAFTAPSTADRRYVIESIQVTNINTVDETVTADWYDNSVGTGYLYANAIPVPVGSSLELLKRPKVIEPSDQIRIQASSNGALSTTILYSTSANVKKFGAGRILSTVNTETVYAATAKARIDSVMITNRGEQDVKVSVSWTNSANAVQSYFSFEMVIPANGSVELLEKSKSIPSGHLIRAQSEVEGMIDVHVSGQLA